MKIFKNLRINILTFSMIYEIFQEVTYNNENIISIKKQNDSKNVEKNK